VNSRTGTLRFPENLTPVRIVAVAMIAFIAVVMPGVAHGQADFEKGYQAYQSYHGTDFDTVNLANGNLVLNIPLLSYEQRGNLPPVVISIRSNSTTFQSAPPFSSGPPDTQQHEVPSGVLGSPAGQPHVVISPGGLYWKEERITLQEEQLSRFVAVDDSGATHSLGQNIANSSAPYIGNIRYSVDGSDLMLTAATQPLILDRKGNIGGLKDPNGNAITLQGSCATPAGSGQFYNPALAPWEGYAYGTASATTITDSIGRVIPNPAYVPPVASYNCIVDTYQAYYPAVTSINNSSCPAAQVFNATTQEAGVAASSTGAPDMASETWNFPSQNGSKVALTFCYQKINVYLILPNVSRTTTTFNEVWPVLTSVILPNNTQWGFVYDYWGQVMSVTTPTGAKTSYAYNYGNSTGTQATRLACGNPPGETPVSGVAVWPTTNLMSSRMVTQRTVTIPNPDSTTSTEQWNYASTIGSGWVGSPNQGQVTVTDSMGNDTLHQFTLIGTAALGQPICGPYETSVTNYQGKASGGIALKNVSTSYTSVGVDHANPTNFSNYIALGVLPQTVTTTLYKPGGSQSQTNVNTFDTFGTYQDYKGTTYPFTFGEKLKMTESDWGSATPVRTTLLTNQWQSNWGYWAANMMDLPCLTTVLSGQTTSAQPSCTAGPPPSSQGAQTSYAYDQSPSPSGARGNLTSVTRWLNLGSSPVTKTTYNAYGMPIYKYDPLSNPTQIVYDTNGQGIYPFEIIHPQTGSVQHTEYFQYDDTTGELLSHTDENNNITHFYYDPMRRLTQTTYPDGGSETFNYTDTTPPSFAFSKVLNSSSATFSETGNADGLGRKYQIKITSDAEGIIFADTRYDVLGRLSSQSNPYRSPTESTYGVTSFTYDALGRKAVQQQPDGSIQQWCYMDLKTTGQTNCNAQLSSISTGSFVDFMDESGNDWQRNSDGLGRLTNVMEPNGSSSTHGTPSMQTTYSYDVLGNLLNVAQTGNTSSVPPDAPRIPRSFNYDSLSRLVCASNPENSPAACPATASNNYTVGTTAYAYDADSNVLTRTQPLVNASSGSQAINYCYDQLNRKAAEYTGSLVANCISWSQVSVGNRLSAYTYDTSSISGTANAVGHLTDEIEYMAGTSVWERSPYGFDTMGRLTGEQQCAFGSCTAPYPFTYAYDYAGNLTSTNNGVTAISPITISYTYDTVARLSTVTSVTPTGGIWAGTNFPATLYTAKEYGPAGILSATYGTKPIYFSRLYDNRQRVTDNTVSSASTRATGTITLACIQTGCTPGTGVVTAVIGGITVSTGTSVNSLSALATNLANAITTADGMPVTAQASSNIVTLTAIEYGKDGEVSLSSSASSGATFTATSSGATLTGDTSTTPYRYTLTYAPNGNVASVVDTMIGNWTYGYDTLDRLVAANATTAGIVTPWGTYKTQCWYYDGFGNRTGEGELTANALCPASVSGGNHSSWATYNTSNQLTANSTVASFLYDDTGNTTNDGTNKYVYDLDGRICAVTTVTTGPMTQYVYDAEGRRVAKGSLATWPATGQVCPAPTSANGFTATATYLRGEHGDQDSELNGSGVWQHTNVFTGGGLTATYDTGGTVTFTFSFSDWLGTKRVQTNANGGVQDKWTSDPFGSYLKLTGSYADATEHHFTGKERDSESGNDYFGARYYESGIGRWVSPDLSATSGLIVSPQRLDRYVYVINNPVALFDADGMKDKPFNASTDKSIDTQRASATATPIKLGTDARGNPIYNKDAYNCHSYAWDEGQGDPKDKKNKDLVKVGVTKWDNDAASKLRGWKQLSPDEPNKPGDRVIYYIDNKHKGEYRKGDSIEHSAIVRTVDSEGNTTTVEGKMGQMGLSENHPNAPGYYDEVKDPSDPDNGKKTSRAYFRKEEEKNDTGQTKGGSTDQQAPPPQQPQQ
jgi:RHS repeat-associated protein